jgi:hypothetical protein
LCIHNNPPVDKIYQISAQYLNVASYFYSKKSNDSDFNCVIDELNEFYVCKTISKLSNPNLLPISRWSIKSIYCCLCIESGKIIKDDFSHGWLGWGPWLAVEAIIQGNFGSSKLV